MAGICGYWKTDGDTPRSTLLDDMLAGLAVPADRRVDRHVDPAGRYALGSASLGVLSQASQPAMLRNGELLAVVDGELYDMELLRARLRASGREIAADDFAAAVLATYANGGVAAIVELEGSFAAAIVDVANGTTTLVADGFGSRPIYYAQDDASFVFASRIAAVLADGDVPHDLDWQGISQFFTFGHYFNGDTSLAAVKVVPAGAALTFDARTKRCEVIRYWSGASRIGAVSTVRRTALEEIDAALCAAVRKRSTSNDARIGLSLSGGLDARTILGLFDRPADRLQSVCLGMAGSRDHLASTQLAAIVGCPHHSHILDDLFLADFRRHLETMVRLTDGQYLSQCIVMPTFSVYQQLGVGVLLRGHGGELMHMSKAYNYSLDEAALALTDEAGLEEWLWNRLQAYLLDGVDGPLFADPRVERAGIARDSLRTAIAATPVDQPPAQRISHLFLDQRVRRETALSLMKFRSVIEPRMPYMDRKLVELLLALPVEWKLDDELQTYTLRKHQPRFCGVENTNTGSVLGAGRLRRTAAGLRMKVCSKIGMPGYQPYERLGLWLRRELAGLVEDVLLDEACLDRGIFAPDTVRTIVRRHLAGQRNHTYLIMAMMVFEVGHRELFKERTFRHAIGSSHQPIAV
jgi:asparagine synthase (glutamine-hydrolysing)